jgi:magnesium-transporting ATPase (P-type)
LKDREENSQSVEILSRRGFTATKWENLTVGDVIKIKQD